MPQVRPGGHPRRPAKAKLCHTCPRIQGANPPWSNPRGLPSTWRPLKKTKIQKDVAANWSSLELGHWTRQEPEPELTDVFKSPPTEQHMAGKLKQEVTELKSLTLKKNQL